MREFVDAAALAFIRTTVAPHDDALHHIAEETTRQGLPRIVADAGRLLQVLTGLANTKRAIEVGTCLGYSATWIARGLPRGGHLETFEVDAGRARQAQENLRRGGVADRVTVTVGDAHAILPKRDAGAYDLVFIDAEKEGMADYLAHALRLLRPGGVLAADNAFWHGSVFPGAETLDGTQAIRDFVYAAARHSDLDTTLLPLGDGLLVARRH